MSRSSENFPPETPDALFGRVVSILDQARGNVVRAVNLNMVISYWLIGREIVHEFQGGEERAAYGKKIVETLSARLTERYGKGYSAEKLQFIRKFYLAYRERFKIPFLLGTELGEAEILFLISAESGAALNDQTISFPLGTKFYSPHIPNPLATFSSEQPASSPSEALPRGFSPQLTWSHYRALMRVNNLEARDFYEQEAIEGSWDKRTLERQIQSFYYERLLKSTKSEKMLAEGRKLRIPGASGIDALKNPYVLEFLGIPDTAVLHESDVERAIITHLQRFLMELGNGFAFFARQKHLRIAEQDRYIDLVFYHCRLKFYLVIDLKVGELTHADVGQMDGYVRMVDDLIAAPDDNPTIGLILCTEKNETVARYSVLNDRTQIFASKYMLFLPTEEQLRLEIEKERRLIEANSERNGDV